jgi:hypothetical protein
LGDGSPGVPKQSPARRPKAKLPPTRHLTASNESDGNESNERKEAGGAPDDIIDNEDDGEDDDEVEESIDGESDDKDAAKLVSLSALLTTMPEQQEM